MKDAHVAGTVIDRFAGEYAFLANFWESPVMFGDFRYRTVEHAFQAAKTVDLEARGEIWRAATPGAAKRLGRRVVLRADWEDVKTDVMRLLVIRKFEDHSDLCRRLLDTGDVPLVEGNGHGDRIWGCVRGPGGTWTGENRLGRILVQVRSAMRAEWG